MRRKIRKALKRQRKNIAKFRNLNGNLSAVGKNSLKAIGNLNAMVANMQRRWAEELKRKERKVLAVIFDRVELQDDAAGLDINEWQQFREFLPPEYQMRMNRMGTWDEISGGDGLLEFHEFQVLMERFVDDVVNDKKKEEEQKWHKEDVRDHSKHSEMSHS